MRIFVYTRYRGLLVRETLVARSMIGCGHVVGHDGAVYEYGDRESCSSDPLRARSYEGFSGSLLRPRGYTVPAASTVNSTHRQFIYSTQEPAAFISRRACTTTTHLSCHRRAQTARLPGKMARVVRGRESLPCPRQPCHHLPMVLPLRPRRLCRMRMHLRLALRSSKPWTTCSRR